MIYSNDHNPAHVHLVGPDCEAKVQLDGIDGLDLLWQVGFGHADLRRVMAEVARQRPKLIEAWNRVHGR